MVANVKYYVVTIVSIFLAIGLGIFIGFMLNAQDILSDQREDIISQLEVKFDYLKDENEKIKAESQKINNENQKLNEFNRIVYPEMIANRLDGIRVGIIETSDDYIYSDVNPILDLAGAKVVSNTTIKNSLYSDIDKLKEIYKTITGKDSQDVVSATIAELAQSLINGEMSPLIRELTDRGLIDISESYTEGLDYIIIGGGSKEKNDNKYRTVDKTIIDIAKKNKISVIGIEKEDVKNSYIEKYKESRISSVDNVNSDIGKMTLVLVMDGNSGNFGVKPSAGSLVPVISNSSNEQ